MLIKKEGGLKKLGAPYKALKIKKMRLGHNENISNENRKLLIAKNYKRKDSLRRGRFFVQTLLRLIGA